MVSTLIQSEFRRILLSSSSHLIGLFKKLMTARRGRSNLSVSSRTGLYTKVNGSWTRTRRMVAEFKFGQTDLDTMASGETVWLTDMDDSSTLKVMSMRENGPRIKLMDMVYTLTLMEAGMKANGSKISNTDSESSNGQMVPSTKVNTNKE